MDIDKLFKVPKLPAKRKMPENPSPEFLKKLKMDQLEPPPPPAPTPATNKGKGRVVTVEEEEDVDMDRTSFAPGGDADYFAEEDEEGRFYGGGLTTTEKDILNIFDNAGGEGVLLEDTDDLSITSIRRMLTRFERAANKNQDQRSKYPDDPTKFIDSEADLDSAIKSLLPLAQAPVLAYPELVKTGVVATLIGLLSHDNIDIVIDVVEVIHELTDEDVGEEAEDDEAEDQGAEAALKMLIESLLENSILELLVDNLGRFNEKEETDRQGVFHILGIFENTLAFNPQLSTQLVSKTTILTWLLNRVQQKKHDENRGYAAEIVSILLQNNQSNRIEFGKKDGVEIYLKVLSNYRHKDPANSDETEFMENVFDGLCSALNEPANKALFVTAEGPDLMVLVMREKLQSCSLAIKTLDYAMSGISDVPICEAFVEALGLKTLFSAFMGKTGKKSKAVSSMTPEDTSHILGIISSLFSNLASDSQDRIRLLAKFVENNYEKVDRLLEIRNNSQTRLNAVEKEIAQEKQSLLEEGETVGEEEEDMWYLRRLDGGLFTLQNTDYIIGWIVMEDDGIRQHVLQMLGRRNRSLKDVIGTLRIYHDNMDDESSSDATASASTAHKAILHNLIAVLEDIAT